MMDSRLYILMRTDLDSMNPGKAMAQAAHAANAFMHFYGNDPQVRAWAATSTQGFGTTITLAVPTEDALFDTVNAADVLEYPSGTVYDPSYPIRDGKVIHTLPLHTCGYVFVPNAKELPFGLDLFELHP